MKDKLIYIIAGLILLNSVLIFKVSTINNSGTLEIKSQSEADSILLSLNQYYHFNNVVNSQLNNDIKLNKDLTLKGIGINNIKLQELVAHGPTLVIRSNENGCSVCIENEIKKVEKFAKIIGDTNVIVITTFDNVRNLIVFKQTNHLSLRIFTCPDLGIPFEKVNNKPFLFMLTPDLITHNFFIPEVSESKISQAYYEALYKRYFSSVSETQQINIPVL